MAHQFIAQLEEGIKDAVFGNVGSLVAFRVGQDDAAFLEHQFQPVFTANDLLNIPNRNAYARILASGTPTKPFSLATVSPVKANPARVAHYMAYSLARYGRPRDQIEAEIRARYQQTPALSLLG
jgi:hypothetical protein